jgi:hypothetical protein
MACWAAMYVPGPITIGFGSRKSIYVDKPGEPKSLFWKARWFMKNLPAEFQGGWIEWRDAPLMRLSIPKTGSILTGEGGDGIGRGDRTTLYFVDEAAHLERPELIEHSLSATTNCRIDVSSVRGMNNPFAKKRHGGRIKPFIFDWRDDPRKDEDWYEQQCHDLDPVTVAQEIDRDYSASISGILIPSAWVRAAIGAAQHLGIPITGGTGLALDVADEGVDKNAACGHTGIEVDFLEQWSGKGSDVFETTSRMFEICDAERVYDGFRYDADGLGVGVRGDARVINEARAKNGGRVYKVEAYRGSGAVVDPEGIVEGSRGSSTDPGRKNQDFFANLKAQQWWNLRLKFKKVYLWRVEGQPCDPDEIISLHPQLPDLQLLVAEISQVQYETNLAGKIVIKKMKKATPNSPPPKSPNLADALVIDQANIKTSLNIPQELLADLRQAAIMEAAMRSAGGGRRYATRSRRR